MSFQIVLQNAPQSSWNLIATREGIDFFKKKGFFNRHQLRASRMNYEVWYLWIQACKAKALNWASRAFVLYRVHVKVQGTLDPCLQFLPNWCFFFLILECFFKNAQMSRGQPLGALQMSITTTSSWALNQHQLWGPSKSKDLTFENPWSSYELLKLTSEGDFLEWFRVRITWFKV